MISKKPLKLTKSESKAWYFIALVGILEAGAVASVNFGLEFGDLILSLTNILCSICCHYIYGSYFSKRKTLKNPGGWNSHNFDWNNFNLYLMV